MRGGYRAAGCLCEGKDAKSTAKMWSTAAPGGEQNRYCPFMDPKPENNMILTQTEGLYDVRQAEEPGPCPQ